MRAKTVDEPRARSPVKDGGKFEMVSVSALSPSPFDMRPAEDPELRELAENIESVGVLEPIVVRQKPGGLYEIICGMRRWKAANMAGLAEVPCVIRGLSDEEVLLVQISENVARKDVPDIVKARQLKQLIDGFGYTQTQIAERLGKDKAWVSHHLKMLELEKLTRVNFLRNMTEGQARTILSAPDDVRKKVVEWMEQELEKNEKVPSMREIQEKVSSLTAGRELIQPEVVTPPPKPEVSAPIKCVFCEGPAYSPHFLKDGRIICDSCFEDLTREGMITKEDVVEGLKVEAKPRIPERVKARCPICGHVIGARIVEVVDRLKERFPEFFEELEEALEE